MINTRRIFSYFSLLVWCSIVVVPFLTRTRYVPIPQWVSESRTIILVIMAWLFLLVGGSLANKLPRCSLWLLAIALVLYIQSLILPLHFPGLSYSASLSFIGLALLAYVTFSLKEKYGSDVIIFHLAWALFIGALLQSIIGFIQVTDFAQYTSGVVFYDVHHRTSNIFGHIGQRNQYAHYLTWGALAVAYLFSERRIPAKYALPIICWLSISIGWSASRTALLYAPLIFAIAALWHWRLREKQSLRLLKIISVLAISLVAVQILMPFVDYLFHIKSANTGAERIVNGINSLGARRWVEWHKAWLVFCANPIFGIGWSQFAEQSALLQMRPEFAHTAFNSSLFTNSHNLILQILAETGIIGSAVIFAGFTFTLMPYFKQKAQRESVLPLGLMSISLLHSMVEYPLWYLYFLAVFVMALGLTPTSKVTFVSKNKPLISIPLVSAIPVVLLSILLIEGHYLYLDLVNLYTPTNEVKTNQIRTGIIKQIIINNPLYAYHALSELTNYIHADKKNITNKLYWLKRMNTFRPYPENLVNQAKLEALSGQVQIAKKTLNMALLNYPTDSIIWIDSFPENEAAYKDLQIMTQRVYDNLPDRYKKDK